MNIQCLRLALNWASYFIHIHMHIHTHIHTCAQVSPTAALQTFFGIRPGLTKFIGTILLSYCALDVDDSDVLPNKKREREGEAENLRDGASEDGSRVRMRVRGE